jgi:hypothetical protein
MFIFRFMSVLPAEQLDCGYFPRAAIPRQSHVSGLSEGETVILHPGDTVVEGKKVRAR